MNIKVIVLTLIIGILLWQIDAGRSKGGRKKKTSHGDRSEISSSSGNDDEERRRKDKDHERGREHKMGEKKDRGIDSSSSSEEDDKDKKNETAINVENKMHQKREIKFEKGRDFKESFMNPWRKPDYSSESDAIEPNLESKLHHVF
ncbi:unnamed protein product [Cercopithifilaria johnstoni]|uniref:Uncharacterized protein n=1 Tax=Cercopithifilaria johnstoni TaxID=2874296 RepID=A0A8J2M843_9BILA|nr:unnamed protein product [Cercopithifilaria johnstoni]